MPEVKYMCYWNRMGVAAFSHCGGTWFESRPKNREFIFRFSQFYSDTQNECLSCQVM